MCCTDGFYLTRELNRGREKLKSIITSFIFILTILSQALCNISQVQQNINTLKSQGIENASNEKIRELYTQLDSQVQEHHKLSETYMDDMSKNAQAMHDKEQSTENKLLGTAGIGLTGIGGMQTLSAVAEQSADDSAQNDMRAYLSTFVCDYGNGTNVKYGDTQIELPGGNTLADLYEQYIALANDLKIRKATLDLPPGIESEPILDSATSGLYDDISIGKTSGTYTSLANAILTPDGPDAAAISDQESKTADKLKTGAITTGIGAIGSIAGNIIINKDAPTENSEKIKSEYESNRKKLETEITKTQTDLDLAIAENKEKISEYNTLLTKHQDFIKTITDPDCIDQFKSYTDYITTLTPITDNFADTSNLTFDYEIQEQQSEYNKCHAAAEALRKKIADCESKQNHKWIDDECVDQTPKTEIPENPDNTDNTQPPVAPDPDTVPPTADPDQCPAYNPRMRSLTDKNRVGDPCVYGDLTSGRVFKHSNGTCSCTALSCKTGYIVSRGVCIKQIKDSQGYCLRTEHPETAGKNNYARLCKTFCQNEAKQKGCKYKNFIMAHTKKQCICNPEQHEIESVQKKTQERQIKNTKFYDVCGSDSKKTGGTERCITEPFNWIQVQMLQATALAKEYALVKYNNNIICEKNTRSYEIDDWLSCSTTDNKIFYEFKFDDVKESSDSDIQQSVRRALCEKIYSGEMMSAKECKLSKADDADKLINSAKKFAISATKKSGNYQNYVVFDHSFKTTYTTKKIKNIDPFAFFSQDIQIRANGKMIDGLYSYVAAKMAPTNVKTFTCNNNPIQIGGTIDGRKIVGMSDDVLTCYVNGTPVDFVFDDMSESSETLSYGGYSNMNCTVVGGTYNGADCMNIGELECERIKKMASGDPVAKQARWNDTTKRCELPAAADATQMQRNINMSIMVGGVIVGMIVTVASGGTAGPALALLAVETAGGAIEIAATNKIYNEIDKFIDESQKCSSATCAEKMLRTNLQRMANMTFDMTDAQKNGIDSELARLANLIPTDSEFYQKILENGPTTADNSKSMVDPDSWEPEQVWRAVGIALQLASIFNSIRKWVVGKFNALPRTTQAISGNASKLTATQAKRLDEIDARLARIQSELESNPSASRAAELRSERTRLTQEKNTISNKIGTKDPDEIAQAKTAAYNAKEIANARQELDNARTALQKRLDWESKQSPGALKNDLQSPRSFGRTARENVRAAEQKLRDMGESVTPMEFRSVDDILKNNTTSGTGTATRNSTNNANNANNTASTPTRTGANNTADASRTSDNVPKNTLTTAQMDVKRQLPNKTKGITKANDLIDIDTVIKQRDTLTKKWKEKFQQAGEMLEKYNIAHDELYKRNPDYKQLCDECDQIATQLEQIRRAHPELWKPGEDVTLYMDMGNLNKKLDETEAEYMSYIPELESKEKELTTKLENIPKQTTEQQKAAQMAKTRYDQVLDEYDEKVSKVRSQWGEAHDARASYRSAFYDEYYDKHGNADGFREAMEQTEEYKRLQNDVEFWGEKADSIYEELNSARSNWMEAETALNPEYVTVSNELEYVKALKDDALKTAGDIRNVTFWEAIPQEIKNKLPNIRDEEIVEILASDDELTWFVNNFDRVESDPNMYSKFLGKLEEGLNSRHQFSKPVRLEAHTGQELKDKYGLNNFINGSNGTHINKENVVVLNTERGDYKGLDGTIALIKHETGHSIDAYAPNDGIIGKTLSEKILPSHGNADMDNRVIEAVSPSGMNRFSVSDITQEQMDQLISEGWSFKSVADKDNYDLYRKELTEQSSWSLEATENIKDKVNAYRKQHMTSN